MKPGDRVLVSCITACGRAASAAKGTTGCAPVAAAGSSAISSTAPRPNTCVCRSPTPRRTPCPRASTDEQVLMVADILPTGYEVGVLNGHVAPGDVVADRRRGTDRARARSPAPGCTARATSSPSIWPTARREAAKQFGADLASTRPSKSRSRSCASSPTASVPTCAWKPSDRPPRSNSTVALARPGGHIANIGVHGSPATLHLEELWIKDVTITTGLVDTFSTPTFLRLLAGHQLDVEQLRHAPLHASTSSSRPTTSSPAPPRPVPLKVVVGRN